MTTSREAFESQIIDCIESESGTDLALIKDGYGDYETQWVQYRWIGWKWATERAAAICDATNSHLSSDYGNGYNQGAIDCEKAIRGEA